MIVVDDNNLIALVREDGTALRLGSREQKDNKAIVLQAVSRDGFAIKFASSRLRNDEMVASVAIKNKPASFLLLPAAMQNNIELVMLVNFLDPVVLYGNQRKGNMDCKTDPMVLKAMRHRSQVINKARGVKVEAMGPMPVWKV